jgi:hypothetical protein
VKSQTQAAPQTAQEPEFITYPDVDKKAYRLARIASIGVLLILLWMFYAAFYAPWSGMHHHATDVSLPSAKETFALMGALVFTVWTFFDVDFLFEFAPDEFKEKHGVGNVQRWKVVVLLILVAVFGFGAQKVLYDTARQMHYSSGVEY